MKWNLTSIVFINKQLPLLLCLFMLSGCVGYPVTDKTNENQYYGFLPGEDTKGKSRNESIIEEEYSSGTQWVFSAEGSRRVVHGDTVVRNYYLKRGSHKISLPFLALADPADSWNQFYYINNAWYGFKYEPVLYRARIIQFKDELLLEKTITFSKTGKEATLYLDRKGNYVVWRYKSGDIYQYHFKTNKEQKIGQKGDRLPDNLVELFIFDLAMPESDDDYNDKDFKTELETLKKRLKRESNLKPLYDLVMDAYTTKDYGKLNKYHEHRYVFVRWAVAENPATPFYILWFLANDDYVYIANAAKKRLKK